jgi:hypothetical protein
VEEGGRTLRDPRRYVMIAVLMVFYLLIIGGFVVWALVDLRALIGAALLVMVMIISSTIASAQLGVTSAGEWTLILKPPAQSHWIVKRLAVLPSHEESGRSLLEAVLDEVAVGRPLIVAIPQRDDQVQLYESVGFHAFPDQPALLGFSPSGEPVV